MKILPTIPKERFVGSIYRPYSNDLEIGRYSSFIYTWFKVKLFLILNTNECIYREGRIEEYVIDEDGDLVLWLKCVVKR